MKSVNAPSPSDRLKVGFVLARSFTLSAFALFADTARGKGVGQALLLTTLLDMHAQGYAYGIIGGVGPTGFYSRSVGAIAIEGSIPGIYAGMLDTAAPSEVSTS